MIEKSVEESFADWEGNVFGFGYGSGEEHTLGALKSFLAAVPGDENYDFELIEKTVTPSVAWLLINTLCHEDVIEYGTSPRYGWLTKEGKALKSFVENTSLEQLMTICSRDENATVCYPDTCNCGPRGHIEGANCKNPFWAREVTT